MVIILSGCVDDRVEYTSSELYLIDRTAKAMKARGDTTAQVALLSAWGMRHAPPSTNYDSLLTATLYARLAVSLWQMQDTTATRMLYNQARPYFGAMPPGSRSQLLRYASYASRSAGDNSRALGLILESLHAAASDSVQFERSMVCFRDLIAERVPLAPAHNLNPSLLVITALSNLFALILSIILFAHVRRHTRREPLV